MEPTQAEVRYILTTTVESIEWLNKPYDGWWVHFRGSRERMNFGIERPVWDVGDQVKITFEKVSK